MAVICFWVPWSKKTWEQQWQTTSPWTELAQNLRTRSRDISDLSLHVPLVEVSLGCDPISYEATPAMLQINRYASSL